MYPRAGIRAATWLSSAVWWQMKKGWGQDWRQWFEFRSVLWQGDRKTIWIIKSHATYYHMFSYYSYYIHFNGLFSRTTWVSRHHKGKPFWILLEEEIMRWQWHQLDHMQIICILLQTDHHTSISAQFLQAGWPSCRSTNSIKALKAHYYQRFSSGIKGRKKTKVKLADQGSHRKQLSKWWWLGGLCDTQEIAHLCSFFTEGPEKNNTISTFACELCRDILYIYLKSCKNSLDLL